MMQNPETGDMITLALDLLERGFHVIPLGDPFSPLPRRYVEEAGGDEDKARYAFSKKARIKWEPYQHVQPTEAEVCAWWRQWPQANIGILTGINVVVVDADTPEAAEFIRSGAITRTPWEVKTPRPGDQFYYRVNPSLPVKNSAGDGMDMRGFGGYVVGAGSTGGNGRRYEWAVDLAWGASEVSDLPMLTAADVAKIFAWRGRSQPADENGEATGDVLGHLGSVRLPHDGAPVNPGGRNNALASLVGQWVHAGYALSEIIAHAKVWNDANPEPLGDNEVMTTVTSIVMAHQRSRGTAIPLERHVTTAAESGLTVLSVGELEDNPPASPEAFWHDGVLFRGARLLIAGAPKIGKSQFMLALGIAAASGGEFLGQQFARPLRVLWVQAEIHLAFVHQRVDRMLGSAMTPEARALVRNNFFVTGRVDLDLTSTTDFALIETAIADINPDIVCFDPVINFSSADENDNGEVRRLLRQVDTIGHRFNCATALVHHIRKGSVAGDFDGVRGASAFRGWFDTGVMLSGESGATVISYQLRNAEPLPPSGLFFDAEQGAYSLTDLGPTEAPDAVPGRSVHRRAVKKDLDHDQTRPDLFIETAIRIINAQPGIMGGSLAISLAKKLAISDSRAAHRVSEVARDPRVETVEEGRHKRYFPATGKAGFDTGNMT